MLAFLIEHENEHFVAASKSRPFWPFEKVKRWRRDAVSDALPPKKEQHDMRSGAQVKLFRGGFRMGRNWAAFAFACGSESAS
ncbi:hypothetical protein ACLKA6_011598 [Drosophila palustris]